MKIVQRVVTGIIAAVIAVSGLSQAAGATGGSTTVSGFGFPESVIHHVLTDRYLVSNPGNAPGAPAVPGYISAIKPNGDVIDYKWIDGANAGSMLNDPLGMAIFGNKLYIADVNTVRVFNVFTGQHITNISIPGTLGLNGITSFWGGVFVSETGFDFSTGTPTGTAAIYKIDGLTDQVSTLAAGPQLAFPNGLLFEPGKGLLVASVGSDTIHLINIFNGAMTDFATLPVVGFDGITKTGGSFYASNPPSGNIYKFDGQGNVTVAASGLVFPVGIGADKLRNRLLIPELPLGSVMIKQL